MLLRGIELPEVGSVRERVMTRMFSMEQAAKTEEVVVMGLVTAAAIGADKARMDNVKNILNKYREVSGFNSWSNDYKGEQKQQEHSDQSMLDRVAKLGKNK